MKFPDDHTQLDVFVPWGSAPHQVCGRIWLTVVFCARSRRVLEYSTSLQPLPDRFVVDRGTEFGAVAGLETLA